MLWAAPSLDKLFCYFSTLALLRPSALPPPRPTSSHHSRLVHATVSLADRQLLPCVKINPPEHKTRRFSAHIRHFSNRLWTRCFYYFWSLAVNLVITKDSQKFPFNESLFSLGAHWLWLMMLGELQCWYGQFESNFENNGCCVSIWLCSIFFFFLTYSTVDSLSPAAGAILCLQKCFCMS